MQTFILRGLSLQLFLCAGFAASQNNQPPINLPSGTKVEIALIRPVWSATVKVGDDLYGQTIFPVTVSSATGSSIGIPPGSYVLAKIESLTRPTRKLQQAVLQIEFRKLVLANGYTVELGAGGAVPASDVTVKVSTANDLILDNGAQVEMTLPVALSLDGQKVAQAVGVSRAPKPGSFTTATLCRFIPGTPGTPDSLVGGTPGTPATVIPGGPGMPDTVIPGIPATPPTRIPGTPGTADQYCPAAPLVISSVPVLPGATGNALAVAK